MTLYEDSTRMAALLHRLRHAFLDDGPPDLPLRNARLARLRAAVLAHREAIKEDRRIRPAHGPRDVAYPLYDRIGPLKTVERQANGYRSYLTEAVLMLRLISSAQNAGSNLEQLPNQLTTCALASRLTLK
jgi:hypothetical protein